MTGLYPTFEVHVGSKSFKSGSLHAPISIFITWNTLPAVDALRLEFSSEIDESFETGEPVSVDLGYENNNITIIKAKVAEIHRTLSKIELVGFNRIEKLTNLRITQSYEGQKAGEIISDICNIAGVETGKVSEGTKFFSCYLDRDKNCFEHLHELAKKCGFIVYMDWEGKLNVREASSSGANHTLTYGENLLECLNIEMKKKYTGVRVIGESPASSEGDDTASWLTKNEDIAKGEAGDTAGEILYLSDSSLRTQEAATSRAEAENLRMEKDALYGRLKILGNPELSPGDTFNIEGFPRIEENRIMFITGLTHRLSKTEGFLTAIDFREA